MVNKKVQRIKLIIAIAVVLIATILICIRIAIYQKEGEKNMPFTLSKIFIISTAQKDQAAVNENEPIQTTLGDFNIIQNNDIYISIEKNKNNAKKNENIKSVSIENIEIVEAPKKGTLKAYMPNSLEGSRFNFSDDYLISQSLTYRGADQNNYQDLQINKQGGNIAFSLASKDIGTYISGDSTEVTYNGKMLSKLGLTNDDVKSKIAFNLVIELDDGKKYSGRINLDLNCQELVESGKSQIQLTDFGNVVFKRI